MKKKFIVSFFISLFSFYFLIFLINIFIDPLWYFEGNKLQKINYTFNERVSKTNLFYKKSFKYDCILFGSSISTTINTTLFKKNKCFNYSFSAGGIDEYYLILSFFNKKINLKKVYIEIPVNINFEIKTFKKLKENFPNIEFIGYIPPVLTRSLLNTNDTRLNKQANIEAKHLPYFFYKPEIDSKPNNFFYAYSSLKIFVMSIKSILGISDYRNAYDKDFIGFVNNKNIQKKIIKKKIPLDKSIIQKINKITNFRYSLEKYFDNIYDFSIPSININSNLFTYDGSHYFENFISLIPIIIENKNNKKNDLILDYLIIDKNYKNKFKQTTYNFIKNNAF